MNKIPFLLCIFLLSGCFEYTQFSFDETFPSGVYEIQANQNKEKTEHFFIVEDEHVTAINLSNGTAEDYTMTCISKNNVHYCDLNRFIVYAENTLIRLSNKDGLIEVNFFNYQNGIKALVQNKVGSSSDQKTAIITADKENFLRFLETAENIWETKSKKYGHDNLRIKLFKTNSPYLKSRITQIKSETKMKFR